MKIPNFLNLGQMTLFTRRVVSVLPSKSWQVRRRRPANHTNRSQKTTFIHQAVSVPNFRN